ncbi:MAG: GspE/PulE/PilB domain-containing protein [Candidatus Chromulinivorax sp.]
MGKDMSFAQRLTNSLLANQSITQKDADSLIAMFHDRAKGRIDNFLLDEGMVDRETLLKALSDVYQVPSFDVHGYFFEHDLLVAFPKDVLINKGFIPLQIDEDILIVVASNPEDAELLETIGNFVSYDIQFNVGIRKDIADAIEEYYDQSAIIDDIEEFDEDYDDMYDEDDLDEGEDIFDDEY